MLVQNILQSSITDVTTCTVNVTLNKTLLGIEDGMYFVTVNATDSRGYSLETVRKVFFVCDNLTSAGTGWNCSYADFDVDGYTEGILQRFNYYEEGVLVNRTCDSCPGVVDSGQDSDGDGIDDACDVVVTDFEDPSIELDIPPNDTVTYDTNISFLYHVSDNDAVSFVCRFYINSSGMFEEQDSQLINIDATGVAYGRFNMLLDNGSYIWNVECSDGVNDVFADANYSLLINTSIVDIVPPVVTLLAPPNGQLLNTLLFIYCTMYLMILDIT